MGRWFSQDTELKTHFNLPNWQLPLLPDCYTVKIQSLYQPNLTPRRTWQQVFFNDSDCSLGLGF